MNLEQIKIYENLLDVVRSCDKRSQIIAAIEAEIAKISGSSLFELLPAEPTADYDAKFEEYWKVRPKRDGSDPKAPAKKVFLAFCKRGFDPDRIIEGARRCCIKERRNVGTHFIPQAVKWLRDQRWEDHHETGPGVIIDPMEARRLEALAQARGNLG
jgi:hypothetical protein